MVRIRRAIICLGRASELWAYVDRQVHPKFCMTRKCISFFHEGVQVAFENRSIATAVQVKFLASKCDQNKGRVHHHANAPRAGEGDGGGINGSVRSSVGVAGCIPTATSGRALDD